MHALYALTMVLAHLFRTHELPALFGLLTVEEAGVPLPLPGDLLVMWAGMRHGRSLSYDTAVLTTSTTAVFLGSSLLYAAMRRWGRELLLRYGRFARLRPERLARIEVWLARRGAVAIVLGRLVPGLRVGTAAVCGLANVPYRVYAPAALLAAIIWSTAYFWMGSLLQRGVAFLVAWYVGLPDAASDWLMVGLLAVVLVTLLGALRARGTPPILTALLARGTMRVRQVRSGRAMSDYSAAGRSLVRSVRESCAPWLRRVYGLPLLYKVLFANSAVVLLGATLGTYLATRVQQQRGVAVLVGFVATGLVLSVVINFVLLKLALNPLTRLRETMRQVQSGDLARKAPVTGRDPDADALALSFNTMLVAIEDLTKRRATHILHAQEEERKRIARELHDETSQVLTSLLISLALLEEAVTTDEARQRIADTRALAHQTLRAVRNLSIDLRPSALDDLGLLPALRWYMKEYQQKCAIAVEFSAHGLKERLTAELETALYRIIQESLTNTAKHARARKVWVAVRGGPERIEAQMRDDGVGFDAQSLLQRPWQDRGLGLAGMMERASLLDGTVEIESQPGAGTTIRVSLPVRVARGEQAEQPMLPTYKELSV